MSASATDDRSTSSTSSTDARTAGTAGAARAASSTAAIDTWGLPGCVWTVSPFVLASRAHVVEPTLQGVAGIDADIECARAQRGNSGT